MGWQSAMVSSDAAGAWTRASIWKRSCSSARSIARRRSGRSGWPAAVRCSRHAEWVMRRVDIISIPSHPDDADAGWRRRVVGNKEGGRERRARVHAILLEVGDAFAGEERVVDEEIAGEGL